ncbi:GNAT family N-acetyltransferase [Lentzea sp. NPDC060358]|uniref:GNAT family N-acetyltransferase n=1 Tax=Lentzea sp. NPDC060358 TaxID=3347103 RepID=UPI00366281EA
MDPISYRPARPTDLPAILQGERSYMEDVEPESLDAWTAALDANLRLWVDHLDRTVVAETGDDLAGYAMWQPDGAAATLITLHVVPRLRRRGLGHRLLERFADDARAAGHTALNLGVHERNPARFLYPAAGYAQTGVDGEYLLYTRAAD